ncbi:MAG TPA: MFS transporter [Sphingomonas sp.]|jgi:Na+/melibiose symporter-like transporter|nr:MFS transporter [Sphingomonas sp.]
MASGATAVFSSDLAAAKTATPPPLTRRVKLFYGSGSLAEAVVISSTTQFLMLYYNQVRGLPAAQVGLAIAAGLVANAVVDPIVGSWSDRTKSRLGRRHPFMFASMFPIALAFFALFNAPDWSNGAQLAWLATFNILLQQALTAFHTPHLAFGGELTTDYIERTQVMSYNTFFLWAGDTVCWLATFGLFFSATAAYPNGALDPSRYGPFSLTIALLVLVVLFCSSFFTRSRIPYLPTAAVGTTRLSFATFFSDVKQALSNRNYMLLLIGAFFLALMQGVRGGLWIYTATYFWQLSSAQITWFALGSFISYVCGAALVARLHRRFDKRRTCTVAVVIYCIGPALPLALGYLGILSADTPFLLAILVASSLLQHLPFSLMTTTVFSALADIADENELRYGARQQGILFSTRTFFTRVDQAVGAALAGWALTVIAFPAKATPGEVRPEVLQGLAAAFVISTIPGLFTAYFYNRLSISSSSHAATRAALDEAPAA